MVDLHSRCCLLKCTLYQPCIRMYFVSGSYYMTMRQIFVLFTLVSTTLMLTELVFSYTWLWIFAALGPIMMIGFYDMVQTMLKTKYSIHRLYPAFGGLRYLLALIQPEIQQYFVEWRYDIPLANTAPW